MINLNKSIVMFSSRVGEENNKQIKQWVPIMNDNIMGNYMGLLAKIGKVKRNDLNFILDRIRKKVNDWKEKRLSYVGKKGCLRLSLAI